MNFGNTWLTDTLLNLAIVMIPAHLWNDLLLKFTVAFAGLTSAILVLCHVQTASLVHVINTTPMPLAIWVYLGVRTCEVFLCFVTIMFVLSIVLTSLCSLFYVTRERKRFLHRG